MGTIENKYNLSPEDLVKEAKLLAIRDAVRAEFGSESVQYRRIKNRLRYLRYLEQERALNRKYRENNRDVSIQKSREYYAKNKDEQNERRRRDYVVNKSREIKGAVIRIQNRRINDSFFKFKMDLRTLIRGAFNRKGYQKKSKSYIILGEEFEFVFMYLIHTAEKRYGFYDETKTYHIDHIVPISSATTEEEVIKLNHWTNLQYLTPEDNLRKGAKLDWDGGGL